MEAAIFLHGVSFYKNTSHETKYRSNSEDMDDMCLLCIDQALVT